MLQIHLLDFHISPTADLKDLFGSMGMTVIDKSLSGHCRLKGTCAKDLKVDSLTVEVMARALDHHARAV
jgi:hypothetical protein